MSKIFSIVGLSAILLVTASAYGRTCSDEVAESYNAFLPLLGERTLISLQIQSRTVTQMPEVTADSDRIGSIGDSLHKMCEFFKDNLKEDCSYVSSGNTYEVSKIVLDRLCE